MNAAHYDRLLHAFESHAKHEQSSDLEVAREVHENLPERCDLACLFCILVICASIIRRNS